MNLYDALKKFQNGEITGRQLSNCDESDVIKIERETTNKGKSLVSLKFSRYEYVDIFFNTNSKNSENSNSFAINQLFGSYGHLDYLFLDYHGMDDSEWDDGYIYGYFSDENKKLLKEIVKYINPVWVDKLEESSSKIDVFTNLHEMFERNISDIISSYTSYYDDSLQTGAKEYITSICCKKFETLGIYKKDCLTKYFTTINTILKIWDTYNIRKDCDSFIEFLKELTEIKNLSEEDNDLFEDYYSYFSYENFDDKSFNGDVERELNEILEKIEDDEDKEIFKKNIEIYNKLNKLNYKFGVWYSLPEQKNYGEETNQIFRLERVNQGKIEFLRKKRGNTFSSKQSVMSFEDFLNYLYHPELFN